MGLRILGTGSYLPERLMTNEDFEKIIDTSDEWITRRTGIKRRHYVSDGMTNADMCVKAARSAMDMAGIAPAGLGGVIVATCTGEMSVPSTAAHVQRAFGVPECFAFDVNAACTGFMYALRVAEGLMRPDGKPFLVCGSETLSRFMNLEDRGSCILFADGAGAVVVAPGDNLKYLEIYSKPDHNHTIEINGMNTMADGRLVPSLVSLKGREVYVYSTREVERIITLALDATEMDTGQVDWFVLHQANARIIKSAAERLRIPLEKCHINIDDVANTSAASVPIVLDQMNRQGKFKGGDKLVLAAFGGGLTSGCAVYEW
jgi:3-oxoacyl-[acyl-carrier-protein] synthase-3